MTGLIADLFRELRLALRHLARQPAVMGLAAISLGLGIGANSTAFSLINALLWRQMPYPAAHELVEVYTAARNGFPYSTSSFPDYKDLEREAHSFSELAAYGVLVATFDAGARIQPLVGEEVTGNYFHLYRIPPQRGRWLIPADDRADAAPAVVVGDRFWRRQLAADPAAVGRTLRLYGRAFTIVGVAPHGFRGSYPGLTADFWLPLAFHRRMSRILDYENRDARGLFLRGRLAPGISAEQARAEAAAFGDRLAAAFPASNRGRAMTVVATQRVTLNPGIDSALYGAAGVTMAVTAIVLLIACMNIGVLMLARAADRRREIAVRLALGCSRRLLVRQLLVETFLLAAVAGGCGLLATFWALRALLALLPRLAVPLSLDAGIDGRVVAFTVAATLLAGLASGLAPALQATKPELTAALNAEAAAFGARSRRLGGRNLLVVTQFAMSTLLLVGALLLLRSFLRQQAIDPGFSLRDGAVVEVAPGLAPHTTGDDRRVLAERILVTARTLPGVRAATLAEYLPLGLATRRQRTEIEGTALAGSEAPEIDTAAVGDGYFETLGIGLLRGRGCAPADRMDQPPVVVVNETMARRFWPGRDPLGQRLRRWGNAPWETVAGIARDSKYQTLGEPPRPFVYRCLLQQDPTEFALLVVGRSNDPRLLHSVRRTLEELDRDLPILNAVTLREHLSLSLFPTRLAGFLLFVFGLLGLVLAAAGLYGLVAHAVARRTRELGIRMALGAHRGTVVRLILTQGMSLVAAGVGLGLALSWFAMRLLAGLLSGVSSRDPLSYLGVTVLLLAVGGLAHVLPVRRATRVDPVVALRAP